MNISRALLGGLVAFALAAGCSSDGGSSSNSKFASCGSANPSTRDACGACVQNHCSAALTKCFGENYSGGLCADYLACASKAADPCKPVGCTAPSGECLACLSDDLASCEQQNCQSECDGSGGGGNGGSSSGGTRSTGGSASSGGGSSSGNGTCADLDACCGRMTNPDTKAGCQSAVSQAKGDDIFCGAVYKNIKELCP